MAEVKDENLNIQLMDNRDDATHRGQKPWKTLRRLRAALTALTHFAPVDHSGHHTHQEQKWWYLQALSLRKFITFYLSKISGFWFSISEKQKGAIIYTHNLSIFMCVCYYVFTH
jgi:hypothetical protein